MPIRMEEDQPDKGRNNFPDRDPSGPKKGNGLLPILLLAAFFFRKRPKLLLLILAIAAIVYFTGGGGGFLNSFLSDQGGGGNMLDNFTFGATLDEEEYDKTEVFEPLAYGSRNSMPSKVSLEEFAPRCLNQGRQGSCVGWASAYSARTILHSRATGADPNQVAFSPSYLYNQIALQNCQGAYIGEAMETMRRTGALPFTKFGYDERSCSDRPTTTEAREGSQYKIRGYQRLTLGGNNYKPDLMAVKQNLAQGAPVVIGMQVGGSFMRAMEGREVWRPSQRDYGLVGFSGHAMTVIGYDDNKSGGSFQIMNSWGERWGSNGIGWVTYRDFDFFVKEAYGLYPMGEADPTKANQLAAKFGLVDNATDKNIYLVQKGPNLFRTRSPISKGDKFKIEVTNTLECYIYVFGEETDGSSYVLFPYTQKHSAFCGIVGTRLFPKDYSMVADELGSRDRIAVVISKSELDYNKLNELINQARGASYVEKFNNTLGPIILENLQFQAGNTVGFAGTVQSDKIAVAAVIEIDKK